MHAIKAVIFDVGRVLVDIDVPGEKFQRLMQAAGVGPEGAAVDSPFLAEIRRHSLGEIPSHELYRLAAERFHLPHSFEDFAEGWCDRFRPLPDMMELFHAVAARRRVGLLSDTDPLHWAALGRIMPWLAEVEKTTLSFLTGHLKPAPESYGLAAKNVGAAKEECLFIDDLIENVDGARRVGMAALQFRGADALRKELIELGIL